MISTESCKNIYLILLHSINRIKTKSKAVYLIINVKIFIFIDINRENFTLENVSIRTGITPVP